MKGTFPLPEGIRLIRGMRITQTRRCKMFPNSPRLISVYYWSKYLRCFLEHEGQQAIEFAIEKGRKIERARFEREEKRRQNDEAWRRHFERLEAERLARLEAVC